MPVSNRLIVWPLLYDLVVILTRVVSVFGLVRYFMPDHGLEAEGQRALSEGKGGSLYKEGRGSDEGGTEARPRVLAKKKLGLPAQSSTDSKLVDFIARCVFRHIVFSNQFQVAVDVVEVSDGLHFVLVRSPCVCFAMG